MAKAQIEPQRRVVFFHDTYCVEHDGQEYIFRKRAPHEPEGSRHAWRTILYGRTLDIIYNNLPRAIRDFAEPIRLEMVEALKATPLLIPPRFDPKKNADEAKAKRLRDERDTALAELEPPKA